MDEDGAAAAFFAQVLGLSEVLHEDGFWVFTLPDGAKVEVFGPAYPYNRHFTTGPVAGFLVDDVVAAADELRAAGVEIALAAAGRLGTSAAGRLGTMAAGRLGKENCDPRRRLAADRPASEDRQVRLPEPTLKRCQKGRRGSLKPSFLGSQYFSAPTPHGKQAESTDRVGCAGGTRSEWFGMRDTPMRPFFDRVP